MIDVVGEPFNRGHDDRTRQVGKVKVRGTTSDGGTVRKVLVNGQAARAIRPNFAEWEIVLDTSAVDASAGSPPELRAHAEDDAGNTERLPHVRAH